MVESNPKSKLFRILRRSALKVGRAFFESDPLSNPLAGDRCIEYAFVVRNLVGLDKKTYKIVLDVGCLASPLTTIVKEIGFTVDGIDLLPSPYVYEGINYIQGDFLSADLKDSLYDVVILCSTVEHIGLAGRYGSPSLEDGDIKALEKVKQILKSAGILILTIPYGQEKIIRPLHRVYNKDSKLLKYAYANFKVEIEEFYKNNAQNVWVICEEGEAKRVAPTEDNYALGLFMFRKI
jgi:SAM-dependent methyltransferase